MCRTIMSAGARRGAMMAHAALRPSRHRGLHRRQGGPGAAAQLQSVGAGDGRLHRAPCATTQPWPLRVRRQGLPHGAGARAVGPHHARHLRLRRAGRDLHRPHQRREQPRLLRGDQRHQSVRRAAACRRTAPACSARSTWRAWSTRRSRRTPASTTARLEAAASRTAVRFLDNVIDVSQLSRCRAQEQEAKAKRRIGLGVTGLADALILCGVRYGTPEAAALAERWMAAIEQAAYLASAELAAEKGAFPLYDARALPGRAQRAAPARATCAPRSPGTASATAASPRSRRPAPSRCSPATSRAASSRCSTSATSAACCERDGTHAHRDGRGLRARAVTARRFGADAAAARRVRHRRASSRPAPHLEMQAALQRHVDSSISKTINCPADISLRGLQEHLPRGLRAGPQGLHHLPPERGDRRGAEPHRRRAAAAAQTPPPAATVRGAGDGRAGGRRPPLLPGAARCPSARASVVYMAKPLEREPALAGFTYKLQLARQRPRHLHHHQRHRAGRPPAPVRDLHQHQEPRALCLDGGADAHDQRRVPPRRRRHVRGRGAEGGVRSAGRPVDGRPLRAEPARGHRRGDRDAT